MYIMLMIMVNHSRRDGFTVGVEEVGESTCIGTVFSVLVIQIRQHASLRKKIDVP